MLDSVRDDVWVRSIRLRFDEHSAVQTAWSFSWTDEENLYEAARGDQLKLDVSVVSPCTYFGLYDGRAKLLTLLQRSAATKCSAEPISVDMGSVTLLIHVTYVIVDHRAAIQVESRTLPERLSDAQ